jgi:hypothetical protein
MAERFGRSLAVLLAIAGLACGGSEISDVDSPGGTYHLQSINQQAIPVIVSLTATTKLEVTASTLTLIGDREFENTTSFRKTEGGQVTLPSEVCRGIYSQSNLHLTFDEVATSGTNCGAKYTGVWNGTDELAVNFDPTTLAIYRK